VDHPSAESWLGALERRTPPLAALLVAVLAVSTSAVLVRYSAAGSLVTAFYRVLFTALLLLPATLVRHRGAFARLSSRDWLGASASGVALALHFAAWFESLAWTSVAASTTLVQVQVFFVAAGGALVLSERVSRRSLAGMGLAFVGICVMSLGDALTGAPLGGPAPLYGNALALAGAACMAGYLLAGRSLRGRLPLVPYVVVVYAVCALVLLALALAGGDPLLGYPSDGWLVFLALAVGPGLLGHTVLNWALGETSSGAVSASLLGEPVGSTLLAALLLGEVPTAITVGGGAVVLAGVLVATRGAQ